MLSIFARQRRLLALDLGTRNVKVMEVTFRGGELIVTGYGEAPVTSDQDKISAINNIVTQRGMTRRTASALSGRAVIVRHVPLATMAPAEIASAVRAEADKYIPFETDKVVVEHQVLETDPAGKEIKVVLVAVRRSVVDDHVAMVRSAGLEPAIIDVDVLALANAFTWAKGLAQTPEDPPKIRALVDIGASKTCINIMRGSISQFAREVYVAGNEFLATLSKGLNVAASEAEKVFQNPGDKADQVVEILAPVLDDLGNEMRLSFEFYETKFEKPVEEVLISGGASQLPNLEKFLERIFDVKTMRWDPTENTNFAMDTVSVDKVKQDSPRLAIAMGLACRALTSQYL
jgi:type IV pilus assembly protein PilM